MYVHPAFKIGVDEAFTLVRERAFGLFVVATSDAPFGVHVPFMIEKGADDRLRVDLHVARINPIHTFIGEGCKALLVCHGPDAYISPDWYGVANQVPTWTYTAVHLKGTARVLPEVENLGHVDRVSAFFEERLLPKKPWESSKMDPVKRAAMLKAIVSIAFEVETVEAQKKLIQHKGETEHKGAIAGLSAQGSPSADAIARLMEESLAQKVARKAAGNSVK